MANAKWVAGCVLSALAARAAAEPVVPRPTFRAPADTCMDGMLNGPESDVDCGGDCIPCPIEAVCQTPRDCESGRCAEGHCAERVYQPGAPLPEGYHLERAENDAAATARFCGVLFLSLSYAGAYVSAVAYPSRLGALYLPAAGPWIALGHTDSAVGKALLASDGALQAAGVILLAGGLIGAKQQLVRDPEQPVTLAVLPSPAGLRVWGSF